MARVLRSSDGVSEGSGGGVPRYNALSQIRRARIQRSSVY